MLLRISFLFPFSLLADKKAIAWMSGTERLDVMTGSFRRVDPENRSFVAGWTDGSYLGVGAETLGV